MSNLQAELETIINSVAADAYLAGQADEPCGADDTVAALQAILATVSKHLPENMPLDMSFNRTTDQIIRDTCYTEGYNDAITEYTKAIQQLFESKG